MRTLNFEKFSPAEVMNATIVLTAETIRGTDRERAALQALEAHDRRRSLVNVYTAGQLGHEWSEFWRPLWILADIVDPKPFMVAIVLSDDDGTVSYRQVKRIRQAIRHGVSVLIVGMRDGTWFVETFDPESHSVVTIPRERLNLQAYARLAPVDPSDIVPRDEESTKSYDRG